MIYKKWRLESDNSGKMRSKLALRSEVIDLNVINILKI